ncbi:MAG: hypothetical protein Q9166_007319 [cf. Caloplaca sp. 2 TL-2023]
MSPSKGEWKYLRHDNLSSNLVQLGHLGQDAFDIGDLNMMKLQIYAQQSFGREGTIGSVIGCLTDPEQAKSSLDREMKKLDLEVLECVNLVDDIAKAFTVWRNAATELEQSVTETNYQNSVQEEKAKIQEDKHEIKKEAEAKHLAYKEAQLKQLEKDKDEAMKIYKRVSRKKHSGR